MVWVDVFVQPTGKVLKNKIQIQHLGQKDCLALALPT